MVLEYLPTFTPKNTKSDVGKYTSTMVRIWACFNHRSQKEKLRELISMGFADEDFRLGFSPNKTQGLRGSPVFDDICICYGDFFWGYTIY